MYSALLLTSILVASTLLPSLAVSRGTFSVGSANHGRTTKFVRPQVVENGTDLVLFPYPYQGAGSIAFTPDGAAYFVDSSDAPNELTRFAPDGTSSKILAPSRNGGPILYAHGSLWTTTITGVIRVSPDGKHRAYYKLGIHPVPAFSAFALGADGAVYLLTSIYDPAANRRIGRLYRLTDSGSVSSLTVPQDPIGGLALGSDERFYFTDEDATGHLGVARIEASGATTTFPIGTCYGDQTLVESKGYIYFSCGGTLGRISPSGEVSLIPLPAAVGKSGSVFHLAVDQGANIWMTIFPTPPDRPAGLFEYNVYYGHFSGPYEQAFTTSGFPFVGPDDNIWFFYQLFDPVLQGIGVYVRHVQTLEPASLVVTAVQAVSFTILETHFNGPWTAQSLNTSVATVSPALSATGTFAISETGPGITSIAVRDRLGNVSYELVTAH